MLISTCYYLQYPEETIHYIKGVVRGKWVEETVTLVLNNSSKEQNSFYLILVDFAQDLDEIKFDGICGIGVVKDKLNLIALM